MLFKDCKFYDKQTVLKTWRHKIISKAEQLLQEDGICVYESALNRYVEYLLEDTHYNIRDNVFYEPRSHYKFTVDVFAQITYEYVLEHLGEFKK